MPFEWPKTFKEFKDKGYTCRGNGKCKGCQERILWFVTPRRKWMPFNSDLTPHWGTCSARQKFKGGKDGEKKAVSSAVPGPHPGERAREAGDETEWQSELSQNPQGVLFPGIGVVDKPKRRGRPRRSEANGNYASV